jgi:hypothetical protein
VSANVESHLFLLRRAELLLARPMRGELWLLRSFAAAPSTMTIATATMGAAKSGRPSGDARLDGLRDFHLAFLPLKKRFSAGTEPSLLVCKVRITSSSRMAEFPSDRLGRQLSSSVQVPMSGIRGFEHLDLTKSC